MIIKLRSALLALACLVLLGACSVFKDIFYGGLCSITVSVNDSSLGAYTVAADADNEGSADGVYQYREGATVTLTATTAGDGVVFDSWGGEYTAWDPSFTFTVTRDADMRLNFVDLDDPWLVLVYMAAANTLESEGITDFNAMESGLFNAAPAVRSNVKVIVLFDRIADSDFVSVSHVDDVSNGDWTGTRLYEVCPDDDDELIASRVIETAGSWRTSADQEEAMGDKQTLGSFVSWAKAAYPAYRRHALILWNHGGGLSSSRSLGGAKGLDSASASISVNRSVCTDDESYDDGYGIAGQLFVGEIQETLETLYDPLFDADNFKLEVLGFDACYMGMYEIAYEYRGLARYFVASPGTEYGGWNYGHILSTASAMTDGASFAKEAVLGYRDKSGPYDNELTAYDLSAIGNLKTAVDKLAAAIAATDLLDSTTQATIEAARDATDIEYFETTTNLTTGLVTEGLHYPYCDIGSLCESLLLTYTDTASGIGLAAENLRGALKAGVVYAWKARDADDIGYSGFGIHYGLTIFFSRGDRLYNGFSHYAYQWYYTDEKLQEAVSPGPYYGSIDAANSTDNATVDTWREMLDSFYR